MSERHHRDDGVREVPTGPLMLRVVAACAATFVVFGFVVDRPGEIWRGLWRIAVARDVLITDYVGVGGLGAAFVNAGLLTLVVCGVYVATRARIDGAAVACLFLVLGFSLFGKNLLNVWPVVGGVALYAWYRREPFAQHINTAFFGAALAPLFSEIVFSTDLPLAVSIPLGTATAVVVGFVLAPVATQLFAAHKGFSLYNMGFTAGIVGTVVVALYRSWGLVPRPVMIWTSGNNLPLGVLLAVVLGGLAVTGLVLDRQAWRGLLVINRLDGRSPTDLVAAAGAGPTLLNMAVTGAVGTGYVLAVGGDLNGPVLGAVFSIVGFAAFGKHTRTIVPVMAGVFLGSLAKPLGVTDPSLLFAALFGTTLAPIAGRFGWHWGVVAGFIHSSVVQTVGVLAAGLNLYNNGFAAGIVAAVLVPVIRALRRRPDPVGRTERAEGTTAPV